MPSIPSLFRPLCCLLALLCSAAWGPVQATAPAGKAEPTAAQVTLRVVGGIDNVSQFTQLEAPFWTQELPRLSQGRFQAEIVAVDRAGIPGMQMLQLLQLGVVPFGTMLVSQIAMQYPQYGAPDLAGLNPDLERLRTTLAAFRPYLEKSLREQHGIEALAIYIYPAQVLFCKNAFNGLAGLSGRRTRVSSSAQADLISALGGVPERIGFTQIVDALEIDMLDCAITGATSGNSLGLHTRMGYLHSMALSWGVAIFGAHSASWNALPAPLQALLRAELPRLEERIWQNAVRETALGVACNSGAPSCTAGRRGHMVVVPASVQDERLRDEVFRSTVLPRWLLRCGASCTALWRETIGPARGIALPGAP